jgi:hypothetical protein
MSMHFQSDGFFTNVWLLLAGLTLATLLIGEAGLAGRGVMLALLAIALVKGQLVATYFMGLRHAGWVWRSVILGYFLVVGGMVAVAYLIGLK